MLIKLINKRFFENILKFFKKSVDTIKIYEIMDTSKRYSESRKAKIKRISTFFKKKC